MKKILLFFVFTAFVFLLRAQDISQQAALQLVQKNSQSIGLSPEELKDVIVSSAYFNKIAGTEMVYLQQSFKGVPVYNQILVLAFKNGKLVSNAGGFINNISAIANSNDAVAAVSPTVAVKSAFTDVKVPFPAILTPAFTAAGGKKVDYGIVSGVYEKVTAELFWLPVKVTGKTTVKLAWKVIVAPEKQDACWGVMVDANTNAVLGKRDMTVYENFDKPHPLAAKDNAALPGNFPKAATPIAEGNNSPSLVATANYLVIPYPFESALYTAPVTVTNPWTLAGGNATSLGWHNDGTTNYTITRGNNAWATEDRAATNTNSGIPATSSTSPDPLNFVFTPNYALEPTTATNQQFAITNLFYWNNIIHDFSYQYGFDEVAGNFQTSNQGRGGAGNDNVIALAQSGAGTSNANFLTPNDGSRPRMRMYLFNSPTPDRDGDIDNGIINHEFTHGISNRLTGGPANSSCLENNEEGGEGWSDYFALMANTNWATATAADGFNIKRPIGNWALGQTATGAGIRRYPYSTNMAINPWTYAGVASSGGEVHDIGEIWCVVLWDMTWALIQTDGINPNMFNANAPGGNSVALKLVTEGMKLQPCSPGFLDARDAILQADQNLYGGTHRCTIIAAFARRGMGVDAKQGSSDNTSDQTVGFSVREGSLLTLTQNVTQQQEGLNIIYTNTVTTGECPGSELNNYMITDTLPANVTYVSGGTYNAATRVVSFPVTAGAGVTQTYSFTVKVNAGSYFEPVVLLDEAVAGPAGTIPAAWTAASTTSNVWTTHNVRSHSPAFSFFSPNAAVTSDQTLTTTNALALGATPPSFSFWHLYNSEAGWDGGVVEISTNGGTSWADLGSKMTQNGYNGVLSGSGANPIRGRDAFTGNSNTFLKTIVNLASYANQSVKLRFRFGSDVSLGETGWNVDDIQLKTVAEVNIRSSIFDAGGVRAAVSDTVTEILPSLTCVNVAITVPPANTSACSGNDATISVTATGTSPTYQWQVSTDGTTFTNIAGATAATLTLTGVTAGMNNYQYKVIVSNSCPSTVTSAAAILTVSNAASITSSPVSVAVCSGGNASFTVAATGSTLTYQWQVSTDGTTFTNIAGETGTTLTLTGVTTAINNNQYRAVVFSCNPAGINSAAATLTVNAAVSITTQPVNKIVCENTSTSFTVAATGEGVTYQWQRSINAGVLFTDITGETAATLNVAAITPAMNGYQYRAVVSGTCTPAGSSSTAATLTVNTIVTIAAQPAPAEVCAPDNATFTVTAAGTGLTYQWQVSTNAGASWTAIAGATTNTLSLGATTTAMNGNQYRVVLNGTCTSDLNSTAVLLKVNTPVSIVSQPVAVAACANSNASFSISALGTSITYQWQVSINGGVFSNISNSSLYAGVGTNQLTITNVSASINGNSYRVIASGVPCGAVTSSSAKLTVNPLPGIVAVVAPYSRINPYVQTSISTTVSPAGNYTYHWYKNSVLNPNITGSSFPVTVDDFGEYKVSVTDVNGCTAFSNNVTVADSASTVFFVYPNPNQGHFQARYYNLGGGDVKHRLTIYDAKGIIIYSKVYNLSGAYGKMDVNIQVGPGVYYVELRNASGERLATGRVSIMR